MAKYYVTLLHDACETIVVDADSREEAVEMAHERTQASLCHQCARHLDMGDAYKEIVCDEDGNEISGDAE